MKWPAMASSPRTVEPDVQAALAGSPEPPRGPEAGARSSQTGLEYFEAAGERKLIGLRELWAYRELALVLAMREVKIRYRQAIVGVAWVVLQPVLMFLVFQVLFAALERTPTIEGVPYALTFFSGWLPWQLLAVSMRDGSQTLVANRQLVTKVYFPRMLLPGATVLCGLLELAISLGVMLALMAWYGFAPAPQSPAVLLFVGLSILLCWGVALWLSALNALYRDIGYVVPFLTQVGFFASPVAYAAADLIPPQWWWYELNPMVGLIVGFRWALLGTDALTLRMIGVSVAVTLAVLVSGLWYFRRVEDWIADRI
jgi:lipopolysaccharide transport system permease protein